MSDFTFGQHAIHTPKPNPASPGAAPIRPAKLYLLHTSWEGKRVRDNSANSASPPPATCPVYSIIESARASQCRRLHLPPRTNLPPGAPGVIDSRGEAGSEQRKAVTRGRGPGRGRKDGAIFGNKNATGVNGGAGSAPVFDGARREEIGIDAVRGGGTENVAKPFNCVGDSK